MINKITIKEKIKEINGKPWYPVEVGKANNQVINIALFDGEYKWHTHDNDDEFFYVYSGKIIIQFKDQEDVTLAANETLVVPKGIEHCPKSIEPAYVLMFEPHDI